MAALRTKEVFVYALILVAGLGIGHLASRVPGWLKPAYTEGNFARYYGDANTNVVMYGTASCPYCKQTREYLQSKKVRFIDLDVGLSAKAQSDFRQLNGKAVPVILIGSRRIQGFRKSAIDDALAVAGITASN